MSAHSVPTPTAQPSGDVRAADIARLRADRGWTQAELAAHLGVERTTVARWESGRHDIQRRFHAPLEQLLAPAHPPSGATIARTRRALEAEAASLRRVLAGAREPEAAAETPVADRSAA